MLTLILVRHAKAMRDSYVKDDSLRHLTARGYEDAFASAQWCKSLGLKADVLVSSPAIRAFSTAAIIATEYGLEQDQIVLNSSIYEANTSQLLYVINELNDKHKTVMLFGHNPGFTDIINVLCGNVINHLPTSAVAVLSFKEKSWSAIKEKSASLKTVFSSHKDVD